ncbi:MAG: hypothetical protein ACI9FJ_002291 [Alteromonadaceae bacterium]|jgi:hypothetical protein
MKTKLIMIVALTGSLFAQPALADRKFDHNILKDTFHFTKKTKNNVKLAELQQGCNARDCIPAIDKPRFGPPSALKVLGETDVVMVVDYNGVQKAYPLRIMQGHEIVNDHFDGKPLAVTYCPLCASAVAFIPEVDGKMVEFGVSGLLHNSDLVMYDRKTESLWGQITGLSIMGPQTGNKLKRVYVAQLTWAQAQQNFTDLVVLLPPTDSKQNYQKDFYAKYFKTDDTMFPVSLKDARLLQKAKVHGFIIDDQPVAVEITHLAEQTALLTKVNGHRINIVQRKDGTVHIKDLKTKQTYVPTLTYWFAWYNFHPNTQLLSKDRE